VSKAGAAAMFVLDPRDILLRFKGLAVSGPPVGLSIFNVEVE